MTDQAIATVTVALHADGSVNIALSPTDRPVDVARKAASLLERYAASIEREQESVTCGTCRGRPTGVQASPAGAWRFEPCGHGLEP